MLWRAFHHNIDGALEARPCVRLKLYLFRFARHAK